MFRSLALECLGLWSVSSFALLMLPIESGGIAGSVTQTFGSPLLRTEPPRAMSTLSDDCSSERANRHSERLCTPAPMSIRFYKTVVKLTLDPTLTRDGESTFE
jgi:hypothetical protein